MLYACLNHAIQLFFLADTWYRVLTSNNKILKLFCVMNFEMVCVLFLCAVYVQRVRKSVKVSDKSVSSLQTTCREAFGDYGRR